MDQSDIEANKAAARVKRGKESNKCQAREKEATSAKRGKRQPSVGDHAIGAERGKTYINSRLVKRRIACSDYTSLAKKNRGKTSFKSTVNQKTALITLSWHHPPIVIMVTILISSLHFLVGTVLNCCAVLTAGHLQAWPRRLLQP